MLNGQISKSINKAKWNTELEEVRFVDDYLLKSAWGCTREKRGWNSPSDV